jgi:hypothetical protein
VKRVAVGICLGALLLVAGRTRASMPTPDDLSPLLTRPVGGKEVWLAQIGGLPKKGEAVAPKKEEPKEEKKEEAPATGYQRVNPRKVMLYSLLLPGLGQQMAGSEQRARVYYGVEAAIWTAWVVNGLEGRARKNRFIEYAQVVGGVGAADETDEYWRTVALFDRSDPGAGSANEYVRRLARALYPGDRAAQDKYLEEKGYFGDRAWDWQSADNLERYRHLRSQSLDSYHRAQYSIGLAIAHRLISMVDAVRLAGKVNRARAAGRAGAATDTRGHFGLALMKDGKDRVPVLTYRMTF